MERSFDLGALLKNHVKKHKVKPVQFSSVAGGVQKRLETNLKGRRSSRLTLFDRIRNLPRCESPAPAPISDAQLKVERRRQQLEKWKEEKDKRKKELASQKKKPFVTGVAHNSLKYVPPPPAKVKPSTSGRVTRSQTAKNKQKVESQPTKASFAPKNASFRPPEMNISKVPTLAPVTNAKKAKSFVFFNPVQNDVPKSDNDNNLKKTRSKSSKPVETRSTRRKPSPMKVKPKNFTSSSSSSDMEGTTKQKKPIQKVAKTVKPHLLSSDESDKSPVMVTPVKTPKGGKSPVPKSESSSEEKLRSPKSDISEKTVLTPQQGEQRISPCVTMSRGKANARKEMKQKIDDGLLDEDNSESESVEHFRRQLASEVARLTELCETWDKILEQTTLTELVQEEILAAVGQARLLMSSKLQQFAALVARCARHEPGTPLVTPADLHGFWDMVFMQIENVDMRFNLLEQRRGRGWGDAPPAPARAARPAAAVKKVAKSSAAPSRLREMIAAARKAKKQQEDQPPVQPEESKTFDAGFFSVQSPVRSPAPATPNNKHNLLKAVLSSEAKKASASKSSSSFAMLRASIMSRNLETEGIEPLPQTPLPQINMNATPGRSILKSTNVKSGKKSIKVVLFDDSDTEQTPTVLENLDSGLSSMDMEKDVEKDVENKENKRKPRLSRQDALEDSGVVTRSRRKSAQTPVEVKTEVVVSRRSSRRKTLQETEVNVQEAVATPKRSSRRRKM